VDLREDLHNVFSVSAPLMNPRFSPIIGRHLRFLARVQLLLICPLISMLPARAEITITEFMAANVTTLKDDDGAYSDWVEIHNPDSAPVDLAGWFLTDTANAKTKWAFPSLVIAPGGYVVVFASNKNRRDPSRPLHTNFALSAGGEYLGLIKSDGQTVASEFAPTFPAQLEDVAYGRVTSPDGTLQTGFLRQPTPGAANGNAAAIVLPQTVVFSRAAGVFTGSVTLELSGAGEGQEIRYVAVSGPGAATAPVTRESTLYTEPLTLDTTTLIKAAVFSADGGASGRIRQAHYLKLDDSLKNFSSQLPVLVVDNLGAGALERDGIDHPSWVFGYSGNLAQSARLGSEPTFATPLTTTVRGTSSAEFPKKGYNLRIRDDYGNRRALPLLDLPAFERWALVAPWSFDSNLFNNAFVYELSNQIGRWAPRTRLAEVFFNADGDDLDARDYAGIYILTDRIRLERGRVDLAELSSTDVTAPAITGGYVLKIDVKDADEIGWLTERGVPEGGTTAIVLVAPSAESIAPAQLTYIQDYVQRMEKALHADRATGFAQRTHLDYIDRSSWVDHHLLNVVVSNPDALHRSAYFHKDRGRKLMAGPVWDFDRALGGHWDDRTSVLDTWSGVGEFAVDVWRTGWWGILAEDPEFIQAWIDRWQTLRRGVLSTAALATRAATLASTIGLDAAARDVARWPDNASVHGDYPAQIAYLQTWLKLRTEWIDAQFVSAPVVKRDPGTLTFTAPPGAVLAYTLDGSDPRAVGGSLGTTALMSDKPLSVPETANIHVRSYDSSPRPGWPASAWSSAAAGPVSSPLNPAARFTTISVQGPAGDASESLLVGFAVADTDSKRYLLRGIGPGLGGFGAVNPLAAVTLSLFGAEAGLIQKNVSWQENPESAQLPALAASVGAFPLAAGSRDAAFTAYLSAGSYSLHLHSSEASRGIALAEFYELDPMGRIGNVSARTRLAPKEMLTLGLTVAGPAYQRLLIRAVGPALQAFGVANALPDPLVTLRSRGAIIASNAGWFGVNSGAIAQSSERVGAFPLATESADAALLVTLAPGSYTVDVKSTSDAEGIVLLEIYDLR